MAAQFTGPITTDINRFTKDQHLCSQNRSNDLLKAVESYRK
jgi:hypothetical protein